MTDGSNKRGHNPAMAEHDHPMTPEYSAHALMLKRLRLPRPTARASAATGTREGSVVLSP